MTTVKLANSKFASRKQVLIAGMALLAVACHVLLRFGLRAEGTFLGLPLVNLPLVLALVLGSNSR